MWRAGLIVGGVMLALSVLTGAINFLICLPCLAVLAGALAGYLGGRFDRPPSNNAALRIGASAGAIAGAGAWLGSLAGGLIGAARIGPEQAAQLIDEFSRTFDLGLPTAPVGPVTFYVSNALTSCCLGLFVVVIMAGLGALGGALWWRTTGQNPMGGATPPGAPFAA